MVRYQWLSNNSTANIFERTGYHNVKTIGRPRKVINVGKSSGKYDILTVEEKRISLIGNNTKINLGMNPREREL